MRVASCCKSSAGCLLFIALMASAAIAETGALLTPTGPYGVGRLIFHFQDVSRPEVLSFQVTDKREVGVWLWYPAMVSQGEQTAPYIDELDALATSLESDEVSLARLVQTHAVTNATPLSSPKAFPVLVFSPGSATLPGFYTSFLEDLASHGYIVAGLDHPYDNAAVRLSDGRVVKQAKQPSGGEDLLRYQRERVSVRVDDVRFVLHQLARMQDGDIETPFKARMDLTRIGVFGHSTGGMTAAEACMNDQRVKACANFDGVFNAQPAYPDAAGRGPLQPFLFIGKPLPTVPGEKPEEASQRIALLRQRGNALLSSVRSGQSYRITVDGATHATFSDEEILSDANATRSRQLLDLTRMYLRAFFDEVFSEKKSALLDSPPADTAIHIEVFSPR
jgi:dienelactone hydrolase